MITILMPLTKTVKILWQTQMPLIKSVLRSYQFPGGDRFENWDLLLLLFVITQVVMIIISGWFLSCRITWIMYMVYPMQIQLNACHIVFVLQRYKCSVYLIWKMWFHYIFFDSKKLLNQQPLCVIDYFNIVHDNKQNMSVGT